MTGDIYEIEKESFWREHQDTLVRIREDLASGKKSRSRFSPSGGISKRTPNGVRTPKKKTSSHPPYGKYRRTPSPFLPKLSPNTDQQINHQRRNSDLKKYEVVPPVKPKVAFTKSANDYDSWGEETEDDDDEEEEEVSNSKKKGRHGYKPQPYPSPMPAYMPPSVVYGAPFPLYYPPPPTKRKSKKPYRKQDKNRGYRDMYNSRRAHYSQPGLSSNKKSKAKKNSHTHRSMPMYAAPFPMMTAMPMMYPSVQEEDEDEDSEDEMISEAFKYFKQHPLFADDFATWFLHDLLDTDFIPDFLIDFVNEMKKMPYDHPMYIPTLYACEDVLSDHISEMVSDIVREVAAEEADIYLDEKNFGRDPLEDFLTDLIDDAVRQGAREVVRTTVVEMAEDYVETEFASTIIDSLVDDYVDEIAPDLLEDAMFEIIAEDFINSEVIASEVKDEATAVARETIQHFDNKITRKELKDVMTQAKGKLADSIIMDYLLSLMTQQGKLWGEEDHFNKFLDDFILSTTLSQAFNVKKQRSKTMDCKPLHKLHEKVVSDVALDVFLQQLTRSLDEDLADVDEYERGVTDGVLQPIPSIVRYLQKAFINMEKKLHGR